MGDVKCMQNLGWKTWRKQTSWRTRHRYKGDYKMDLREVGYMDVDPTQLYMDRFSGRILCKWWWTLGSIKSAVWLLTVLQSSLQWTDIHSDIWWPTKTLSVVYTFTECMNIFYHQLLYQQLSSLCTSKFLMVWGNGSLATMFSPLVKPVNITNQLLMEEYCVCVWK